MMVLKRVKTVYPAKPPVVADVLEVYECECNLSIVVSLDTRLDILEVIHRGEKIARVPVTDESAKELARLTLIVATTRLSMLARSTDEFRECKWKFEWRL